MSILAIDTATEVSSVALVTKDRVAAEIIMQAALTHSATLMPHIKEVMALAKTARKDLTGIAVSIGPGSFTGLRIGVATAKAMAYALELPLVGVPTLTALVYHYPVAGVDIVPLIDAQKGNVYVENFTWEVSRDSKDKTLISQKPLRVEPIEQVLASLADNSRTAIILGDGLGRLKSADELPPGVTLAPPHLRMPRASLVGMASLERIAKGDIDEPMLLEPLYIRRSEAEVLWEKRQAENNKG